MKQLINYLLFLCIGCCFSFFYDHQLYRLLALLSAVILASVSYLYTECKWLPYTTVLFAVLAALQQSYLYYLPLLLYCVSRHFSYPLVLYLLPILFHLRMETLFLCSTVAIFSIFAILLRQQWEENEEIKLSFIRQRDATKELADMLSNKNRNLLVQQEQEIRIAILDERNRIAREIHDHVGHLLSSSLLQIGAIQAIQKEEKLKEPLQNLRNTLSQGMDNVRSSVHDLHDDALDLQLTLNRLLKDYSFCEAALEYDVLHPLPQQTIYHILAIVKESMNNTMKHSNATRYRITVREQPAFYQLILRDNGTKHSSVPWQNKGIGLSNMRERVEDMHGYLNITRAPGFQIYITLPKEDINHENTDC